MPLLEISNAQPSFQYPLCSLRAQDGFCYKLASSSVTFGYEHRVAWKFLDKHKKLSFTGGSVELQKGRLQIKAVATLGPKRLSANENKCKDSKDSNQGLKPNPPPSHVESKDPDDKEKMRRMRISKANKGITPWNKGRKHSPETLQKIRERTRLAMQNPKVKMKLVKFGHAQTSETKLKIGAGVKKGWARRRGKKMMQETCCFEWQNLIAEASRQGCAGEEELQWNSYETLREQLKQEWLESVDQRKTVPKVRGSRRAPKTVEQRRKIAEAISTKWADPDYRERVVSAMAKYHGIEDGAERKSRRRPSDGTQSTRMKPIKERFTGTVISLDGETKVLDEMRLKRSKAAVYKDPLVGSKLEMIKNIRAQRAAAETKQIEAIERARLLIAEAEKAANALEIAASKSPVAQASLIETRKLIAEAIQSLESIDTQHITESNGSSMVLSEIDEEKDATSDVPNQSDMGKVNGHSSLSANDHEISGDFCRVSLQKLLNSDPKFNFTTTNGCTCSPFGFTGQKSTNRPGAAEQVQSINLKTDPSPTMEETQSFEDNNRSSSSLTVTKKWVRGRFVEVVQETQENSIEEA